MHDEYLLKALALAQERQGFCAPNPSVGAVVVQQGKVVGEGYHLQCGAPHAEVVALSLAGEQAFGATIYVTLEPCCHHGRTPPCTELLIKTGIREVVYAFKDPNPVVCGQGEQSLLDAGIAVNYLPLPQIDAFYHSYQHWTTTRTPLMTAKIALSLDGKIAAQNGQPFHLTGEQAALFTHQQRKQSDVILTSLKTVMHDDPQLNVRLDGMLIAKPVCVLDRSLSFPLHAKLTKTAQKIILLHDENVEPEKTAIYQEKGIECHGIPVVNEQLDLRAAVAILGKKGFHHVWVEAGGAVMQTLLTEQLLQRIYFYIAPIILGEMGYTAFSTPCLQPATSQYVQWSTMGMDGLCQIDFSL